MPFDLERVGHVLKTAREGRGLTIDEVSRALFIRKTMISAIESGDWQRLPHPVYVKGYINQYAAYLAITDEVRAEFMAGEETTPVEEKTSAVPPEEKMTRKWEPKRWRTAKKAAAAAVMSAIVVAFMVFLNTDRTPQHASRQPSRQAPAAVTPAAPSTSAAPSVYQTVATTEAVTNEGQGEKRALETKKLMIACQERTWVRVMIDDSEKKELMMNPEEVVVLNAKDKFDLLIGNAGGVKLFYNGKDAGFTGETGEVKRITLS